VLDGQDGARSVVPLALLGGQAEQALRQINTLLDASAGSRQS
jgi:hypothetical protein